MIEENAQFEVVNSAIYTIFMIEDKLILKYFFQDFKQFLWWIAVFILTFYLSDLDTFFRSQAHFEAI